MIKLDFQVNEWHTPLSEDIPCYHFTITPIHTMEKRNEWIKKKNYQTKIYVSFGHCYKNPLNVYIDVNTK